MPLSHGGTGREPRWEDRMRWAFPFIAAAVTFGLGLTAAPPRRAPALPWAGLVPGTPENPLAIAWRGLVDTGKRREAPAAHRPC